MMELGSVNRLFFEKKLEFLGIPKFFYGKSCFMKLEKLRSVSFPQILGVRHPRIIFFLRLFSMVDKKQKTNYWIRANFYVCVIGMRKASVEGLPLP